MGIPLLEKIQRFRDRHSPEGKLRSLVAATARRERLQAET